MARTCSKEPPHKLASSTDSTLIVCGNIEALWLLEGAEQSWTRQTTCCCYIVPHSQRVGCVLYNLLYYFVITRRRTLIVRISLEHTNYFDLDGWWTRNIQFPWSRVVAWFWKIEWATTCETRYVSLSSSLSKSWSRNRHRMYLLRSTHPVAGL